MIQVKQLTASRRKHTRVRTGLVVEMGEERLDVLDWSAGGLRVAGASPTLAEDGDVTVQVMAQVDEVWINFGATVRVVRVGPAEGEVALEFVTLPAFGREVLGYLSQSTADGEPASVLGVLDRLDPGAMEAAPGGAGLAGAPAAKPTRPPEPGAGSGAAALRVGVYVIAGLALTAWLANGLYHRVWRIEVDSASLVAPAAKVVSPADGVLRELAVASGDAVTSGGLLFTVDAPSVKAALERETLEVEQARVRVEELEAARDAELARLSIHGRMLRSRVSSQRAQVALLHERLAIADSQVGRIEAMLAQGMVSNVELEEFQSRRAAIAGQAEAAASLLATEEGRLRAAGRGFYVDGDRIEGGLPEVEAALVAARAEVQLQEDQLDELRARVDALQTARAPFDGHVARVAQAEGTPVRQGSLVVVVEEDAPPRVEAWLTREEAGYVRIGDVARVEVPGLGRTFDGEVLSVETHTEEGSQVAAAGLTPRLEVLLEIGGYAGEPETAEEARAELQAKSTVGLPAVVSFPRSWR